MDRETEIKAEIERLTGEMDMAARADDWAKLDTLESYRERCMRDLDRVYLNELADESVAGMDIAGMLESAECADSALGIIPTDATPEDLESIQHAMRSAFGPGPETTDEAESALDDQLTDETERFYLDVATRWVGDAMGYDELAARARVIIDGFSRTFSRPCPIFSAFSDS